MLFKRLAAAALGAAALGLPVAVPAFGGSEARNDLQVRAAKPSNP